MVFAQKVEELVQEFLFPQLLGVHDQHAGVDVAVVWQVQHVFDVSNYMAKTVGLTCANGISNDARLATFAQNDDTVKGVEILNSLDGRTCLARGQLIQTPNGEKPIETVKTGDFVIGGSQNRRRVLGTSTKKVKQIVVVTLSNGEKIRCTADHLFLTENKEWKDAGRLRIGERLAESL